MPTLLMEIVCLCKRSVFIIAFEHLIIAMKCMYAQYLGSKYYYGRNAINYIYLVFCFKEGKYILHTFFISTSYCFKFRLILTYIVPYFNMDVMKLSHNKIPKILSAKSVSDTLRSYSKFNFVRTKIVSKLRCTVSRS